MSDTVELFPRNAQEELPKLIELQSNPENSSTGIFFNPAVLLAYAAGILAHVYGRTELAEEIRAIVERDGA